MKMQPLSAENTINLFEYVDSEHEIRHEKQNQTSELRWITETLLS